MTGDRTEKACRHWLYQAAGMNGRTFLRRLQQVGTAYTVYELAKSGVLEEKIHARYGKRAVRLQAAAKERDLAGILEEYERMCLRGISFVTIGEAAYPHRLSEIQDAPYALYYAGKLPVDDSRAIAVIGARNCTEYGRYVAKEFGTVLAQAGVQVISGMARGIDGIGQRRLMRVVILWAYSGAVWISVIRRRTENCMSSCWPKEGCVPNIRRGLNREPCFFRPGTALSADCVMAFWSLRRKSGVGR